MADKEAKDKEPGKKKRLLKKIGIGIVVLVLIIAGFFLGIYLQIFDSDEMNKKMGLYNMPVVGQFFPKPVEETPSTVPDDSKEKEQPKKNEKSKAVKLDQKEIDKLTQQRQAEEKKRVSKLARLYNEMKPEDAARILETMENDIVIAIFQRMDESQVSQILTEFDPDRAATISKIMYVGAPKRVQQITNENGGVQ